jgi:NADPH:quinone reductase-like Zn-dependent oxidoreductase
VTQADEFIGSAGLRPIATCSPSNFDLIRRFGAEQVFDYRSPTCAADIRAYTKNELAYALDCITLAETTQLCYESLGRAGGRYVGLEPFRQAVADTRALTVRPSWLMVLTIFGTQVALNGDFYRDAQPEDREFGAKLFSTLQAVMDRGSIEPHPIKAMTGGWQGVLEGVDMIRNSSLSAQKLVYSVA